MVALPGSIAGTIESGVHCILEGTDAVFVPSAKTRSRATKTRNFWVVRLAGAREHKCGSANARFTPESGHAVESAERPLSAIGES